LKSYGSGSDFWQFTVPVPVAAPDLDHKKQIFQKNLGKNLAEARIRMQIRTKIALIRIRIKISRIHNTVLKEVRYGNPASFLGLSCLYHNFSTRYKIGKGM
jgi:hypothetical protein